MFWLRTKKIRVFFYTFIWRPGSIFSTGEVVNGKHQTALFAWGVFVQVIGLQKKAN